MSQYESEKYLDGNCSPGNRVGVIDKGQSIEMSQYESVRQSARDKSEGEAVHMETIDLRGPVQCSLSQKLSQDTQA